MYERELAEIYDAVYRGRGRDYAAEAAEVARLVRRERPEAASLLDVACGTGAHLEHLGALFPDVAGVELSAAMLEVARARLPGVPLHRADMRDFALGRTFDAVTCMFSSIGHMGTVAELRAAVAGFARHLAPGGVAVVEPWWFPERFADGYVAADVVTEGRRTIARVSHSVRDGGASRVQVRFLVAEPDTGIRPLSEDYRITLFERAEYEDAFTRAGCAVRYAEDAGGFGRGLFVGVRD